MKRAARDVVFLCTERQLTRERRGYFNAFRKRGKAAFLKHEIHSMADFAGALSEPIGEGALALHDGECFVPRGLENADLVTSGFHIDTFSGTGQRIRLAGMFDYNFVFHPGFENVFREAGIRNVGFLPHAVEAELFEGSDSPIQFEIGWVGALTLREHANRRRILRELGRKFAMNDIEKKYSTHEMAAVYRASRVVVNFSREDYPRDANLRCFEAMAAGALLVTRRPCELTEIGFQEGVHFAGYGDEVEIEEIVGHYLNDEGAAGKIAAAGRDLVLSEHTYDRRVDAILDTLETNSWRKEAASRRWTGRDAARFHCWRLASGFHFAELLRYAASRGQLPYACALLVRYGLRNLRHGLRTRARS